MKKLILSGKVFRDLKDVEILGPGNKPIFIGEYISNVLVGVSSKGRDGAKCIDLAMRFLKLEDTEVTDVEFDIIKAALRENGTSVLFEHRINQVMDTAQTVPEDIDEAGKAQGKT